MNLGEMITTSDHSYHITLIMYVHGQNWPYYFFSNKPHCNTTISVEKGQKSWFGIIIGYIRTA